MPRRHHGIQSNSDKMMSILTLSSLPVTLESRRTANAIDVPNFSTKILSIPVLIINFAEPKRPGCYIDSVDVG